MRRLTLLLCILTSVGCSEWRAEQQDKQHETQKRVEGFSRQCEAEAEAEYPGDYEQRHRAYSSCMDGHRLL
jgi:hypothetical protein